MAERPVQMEVELEHEVGPLGRVTIHALLDGESVGRLEYQQHGTELTVWRFNVVPELQGNGVGTRMAELMVALHPQARTLRLYLVTAAGRRVFDPLAHRHDLMLEHAGWDMPRPTFPPPGQA